MDKKILLTILPYWDPMIPPLGITTLKEFLQKNKYSVYTLDLIVKKECLDFYNNYFSILKENIPKEKRGNFNNVGHDVLQNQMMAHQRFTDKNKYLKLIKDLIYNHYYVDVDNRCSEQLFQEVDLYYKMLEEYFIEVLKRENPDVIGATVYKCTLPSTLFVLKLAKKYNPSISTIIGGGTFNESHAPNSPNFEALLKETENYVDKIIIGQGELLFLSYLQNKLDDSKRVYTKDDIGGEILGFEDQSIPDFSDLDMQKYPYLAATSSVSCIYQCSFCVASKVAGKYRTKKSTQTVCEMDTMHKKYNKQLFFMTDSLINPVLNNLSKEFINSEISLYYDAYFKVDPNASEIRNTLLWRKGGLYRVRLGAESGSQRILNEMDKGITVQQIKDNLAALAYAGIKTTTYWVIGHPGESEEDFQQTLDLLTEMKNDIFQAECNYFLYHYSNQHSGDKWAKYRKLIYSDEANQMLLFKHYTLTLDPVREETFRRVNRFEEHCRKLGIPNPYSYAEHIAADERWKKLHKNAVPPLMDFFKNKYIDENQKIEIPSIATNAIKTVTDFSF